jgi:D-3-phosphoglycerate dehydrogenase
MVPRILVADALSPRAADVLAASGLEVVSRKDLGTTPVIDVIDGFDGLLVRSATKVDAAMFARASRLKIVGRAGIGVDNVDVAAATANGVVVMNTPLGNATTTAEHAISMMMALTRMIPQATASMKAGRWEKNKFNGREVTGKRIGILGLGNIGKIVADRARGLHMEVLAYDPFLSVSAANELDVQKVDLDQLFAEADYVTIHTPLTEETRHLVGAGCCPG